MTRVRAAGLALLALAACGGGGGGGGGSDGGDAHRIPTAAEVVGTYDLTATFRGAREPALGLGVISVGSELRLALTTPPVALHGALQPDGRVTLTGNTTLGDALTLVSGNGKIVVDDDVYRFVGFVEGGPAGDAEVVMERPVGTDARPAAGGYRLVFTPSPGGCGCTGSLDVVAAFDAAGGASIVDAREVDAAGVLLATMTFAFIDLAPSGRFHFEGIYALPGGSCPGFGGGPCQLELDGFLPFGDREGPTTASYVLFSAFGYPATDGTVEIEHSG